MLLAALKTGSMKCFVELMRFQALLHKHRLPPQIIALALHRHTNFSGDSRVVTDKQLGVDPARRIDNREMYKNVFHFGRGKSS